MYNNPFFFAFSEELKRRSFFDNIFKKVQECRTISSVFTEIEAVDVLDVIDSLSSSLNESRDVIAESSLITQFSNIFSYKKSIRINGDYL